MRRAEVRHWGGAAAAALLLFLVLAVLARRHAFFRWDLELAGWIQALDLPGLAPLLKGVSLLGMDWIPFLLVGAAGTLLLLGRNREAGIVCLSGVGGAALINRLLKLLVARPRPGEGLVQVWIHHTSSSFPSGHVTNFVTFFGFLFFLTLGRRGSWVWPARILLGTLLAAVGISRVYLGAHWPSDALGGYLFGGLALMSMIAAYKSWRRTP